VGSDKLYIKPKEFRIGILLGVFIYCIFGIADSFMMPIHYRTALLIRFCVVLPGVILFFLLSFNKKILRYGRLLLIILATASMLGINYMIMISDPSEGAFLGYYVGLIIVILWSSFVFQFSFYETIFVFLSTLFVYNFVAVYFQKMLFMGVNAEKLSWFVGNNFFLISAGIIAAVGSYRLQKYRNRLEEETENHKEARGKAEESDNLKSAFLANMSHEIRTPMNSILGFSQLLQRPDLDAEKRSQFAKVITTSGEQLMRIIDDVIDISKIESNHLTLKKEYIKLNDVLAEFIESHDQQKKYGEKQNIRLVLSLPEKDRVDFIYTDPVRFTQILNNLYNNALKNTDEGSIEIGYQLISFTGSKYVRFYITDTGIGIPKEKFGLIFERFGQVSGNRQTSGTGLGLSISRGLVNLLGGMIWVESTVGKGSTFYFTHPYEYKYALPDEDQNAANKNTMPDLSGKLVYVAEDDVASMLYLKEILSETKINIRYAANGKLLLQLMKEKMPDIVLMDINMPEINGYEALKAIRVINKQVPVIAQTAYALSDEREKCLDAGFTDYIPKPLSKDLVIKKLYLYTGGK